eukprot:640543-Amphidinium_carterae.2
MLARSWTSPKLWRKWITAFSRSWLTVTELGLRCSDPLHPTQDPDISSGVLAGDPMAMKWMMLITSELFVVDDIQVAWEGPPHESVEEVKLPVSCNKTFVMASTAKGVRALQRIALQQQIKIQWQARFVGGQVVSGRRRRVAVKNKRMASSHLKLKRLRSMRLAIKHSKHPMRASVAASGIAEGKAHSNRARYARALVKFSRSGSPQVMATVHPGFNCQRWSRCAHARKQFTSWCNLAKTPEFDQLSQAAALGFAAAQIIRSKHGWSTVHGPVAATQDGTKRIADAAKSAHDNWSESLHRFASTPMRGACAEARDLAKSCLACQGEQGNRHHRLFLLSSCSICSLVELPDELFPSPSSEPSKIGLHVTALSWSIEGSATSPLRRVAAWAWAAYDQAVRLIHTNQGFLRACDSPRQTVYAAEQQAVRDELSSLPVLSHDVVVCMDSKAVYDTFLNTMITLRLAL